MTPLIGILRLVWWGGVKLFLRCEKGLQHQYPHNGEVIFYLAVHLDPALPGVATYDLIYLFCAGQLVCPRHLLLQELARLAPATLFGL